MNNYTRFPNILKKQGKIRKDILFLQISKTQQLNTGLPCFFALKSTLEDAIKNGAIYIEVTDFCSGTIYYAPISFFLCYGKSIRNQGEMFLGLYLEYWEISHNNRREN